MADRATRGRVFRRGPKRTSVWVASADQGTVATATGATTIVQSNATFGNTTIVRTRGLFTIAPQALGVGASVNIRGAIGFGIVSDQAFAAGASSVPGPWTDPDWAGWYVWMPFELSLDVAGTPVERLLPADRQYVIDSKAMRKVESNETVVVMAESQGGAFNSFFAFRTLAKLA